MHAKWKERRERLKQQRANVLAKVFQLAEPEDSFSINSQSRRDTAVSTGSNGPDFQPKTSMGNRAAPYKMKLNMRTAAVSARFVLSGAGQPAISPRVSQADAFQSADAQAGSIPRSPFSRSAIAASATSRLAELLAKTPVQGPDPRLKKPKHNKARPDRNVQLAVHNFGSGLPEGNSSIASPPDESVRAEEPSEGLRLPQLEKPVRSGPKINLPELPPLDDPDSPTHSPTHSPMSPGGALRKMMQKEIRKAAQFMLEGKRKDREREHQDPTFNMGMIGITSPSDDGSQAPRTPPDPSGLDELLQGDFDVAQAQAQVQAPGLYQEALRSTQSSKLPEAVGSSPPDQTLQRVETSNGLAGLLSRTRSGTGLSSLRSPSPAMNWKTAMRLHQTASAFQSAGSLMASSPRGKTDLSGSVGETTLVVPPLLQQTHTPLRTLNLSLNKTVIREAQAPSSRISTPTKSPLPRSPGGAWGLLRGASFVVRNSPRPAESPRPADHILPPM